MHGFKMDIIPAPKTNIIMDSQVLSSIMSCGRMTNWNFNEDLQAKTGKSVSLEMGSIVHAYLENKFKQQIGGMKKAQAIAYGMTAAMAYSKSDEVTNSSPEDIQLALNTCIEYENYYVNDTWTPLEVECVKGIQVYEDDKIRVMWKAKYDLITDTGQLILPVDHKTMKQRRDSASLNNQFMGQCVIMNSRRMIINKIGFQKTLKPSERCTRVVMNYTEDRLKEWATEIVPYWAYKLIEYTESNYWPPNFTHCENKYGFCKYKEVCEVNRNMRDETLKLNFIKGKKWDISNALAE